MKTVLVRAREAAASARMADSAARKAQASANAAEEAKNALSRTDDGKVKDDSKLESVAMQLAVGADLIEVNGVSYLQYYSFKPDFSGLVDARKVCRCEMAKIVNEVDLITKHPKLALDTSRDDYFLEPLIYRQLLPVSVTQVHRNKPLTEVKSGGQDLER